MFNLVAYSYHGEIKGGSAYKQKRIQRRYFYE